MAEFILCAIITLCFTSLYVSRQKRSIILFDTVCDWYIIFVAVHACYALILRYWFAEHAFAGLIAPFGLAYGPFFYFGFKSLLEDKIYAGKVLIHSIPAVLFWVLYLIIVFGVPDVSKYLMSFYVVLYAFTAVSLIGYAIWAVLFTAGRGFFEQGGYAKEKKQFMKTSGYTLIVMSGLFAILIAADIMPKEDINIKLPGMVVYCGMFTSLIFAFRYKIKNLFLHVGIADKVGKKAITEKNQGSMAMAPGAPVKKYTKSGLTPEAFEDYKIRLDNVFEIERVYLDSELTLESLARKLKVPPHHLTQLFSMHIGENFNQYLNKYRIKNAGELLQNNVGGTSMEDIAFRSGFNNKVSFNRHFKNLMGCTPKEYLNKVNKPD